MGGHLDYVTVGGITVVLYLALVSAVAYTLWSVLLAYNDVSKVAIFGFVNPLCSVILSALVLGEDCTRTCMCWNLYCKCKEE